MWSNGTARQTRTFLNPQQSLRSKGFCDVHGKYYYSGVKGGGGTRLHYLWLVQLKLFPFPHQLGSLVKEPSVCGYSAWLRSTENAGLFFYYNSEWASIKGALKAMFWIRKTPFIKVILSLCVCLCTSVSIWQIEGKAVQQQCMTFHQWLCSLLCLTFKTG